VNLLSFEKLIRFGQALVNQEKAKVIVEPYKKASGFWFGAGNMVQLDDTLYLVGRYRNAGDSRTGLSQGERGLELAVFKSKNKGDTFEAIFSLSKAELTKMDLEGKEVKSIEGSALNITQDGVELYISSEKAMDYPENVRDFQKPGTGVWTIEYCKTDCINSIPECTLETILTSDDPRWLHVKDPTIHRLQNGDTLLGFVTHPFNWTSSNTAYYRKRLGIEWESPVYDFFRRGYTWDVAISRATAWLNVPAIGEFKENPRTLIFYDGGECVRDLDEHSEAVKRPRGYSCEELGGLAVADKTGTGNIIRLSVNQPLFVSQMGTGCSRYVDILETGEGFYVTWQQSQDNHSQPLMMNYLSQEDAKRLLI
jgi:hypothetical protein